jgi:hypothetical protein
MTCVFAKQSLFIICVTILYSFFRYKITSYPEVRKFFAEFLLRGFLVVFFFYASTCVRLQYGEKKKLFLEKVIPYKTFILRGV